MEYLDIYDENKKLTGRKILRSNNMKLEEGEYINIVIVFMQNSEGKFLIQKTSKEKGGVWATTGGHVKAGTTCDEAILEEISEELGINVSEVKHVLTEKRGFAYQDIYYLKKDIDISDVTLQKEEVECVKWLSIDEINKLIEEDKFRRGNINAFKYIIENGITSKR